MLMRSRFVSMVCQWLVCSAIFLGLPIQTPVYAASIALPDFTQLVEKYQPTVVNISTTRTVKPARQQDANPFNGNPQDPMQEMLRRFFGEQFDQPEEYSTKSLGSGFIISADGYVLTNNHVIHDADEIIVRLADGREFDGKLVGSDEGSDLALIKIDAKDLPTAHFGSSTDLKVGEWVLAIGSPFGFEHTVTSGIVSAKKRGLRSDQYVPFIQTDVPINPGNSGGPLFNMKGEVVGINAQIISRTGGYLGLSFSIPSDTAVGVIEQLKSKGYVSRGWLGVAFQSIDRTLAKSFGLDSENGALVAQVVPDSPASKAGLQQGDIITMFDGKQVTDALDLSPLVGAVKPGTTVPVTLMRNKKSMNLSVKIAELSRDKKGDESDEGDTDPKSKAQGETLLGIQIREITDAERSRYELGAGGVLIEQIKRDSSAYRAGVRRGDILLSVNMQAVNSQKQFAKATKSLTKNQTIPILINRHGEGQRYFAVKVN